MNLLWYNYKGLSKEWLYLYVESIRIINFRNYENLNIKLSKNINIFVGKNAQGKTNLLESIYFCAVGKSFRTNKDKDMINFNSDKSYIGINIKERNIDKLIEIKLERNAPKKMRINGIELGKNKELNSGLNVVVFSPDDLKIIKEGPQERRNFLDLEISQLKPLYRYNLNRYNKILFQRNNLLRFMKYKEKNREVLETFNIQLIKTGSQIILERKKFIDSLSSISKRIHGNLTFNEEKLDFNYVTNVTENVNDLRDLERDFFDKLNKNIDNDILKGSTEIGPHRDDIEIIINDFNSKQFASQGQQRTAILSIKLAEVELIENEKRYKPVLLLDDVLSELDEDRRRYLIKSFSGLQTIITSADVIRLKEIDNLDKKTFYIEKGKVM
ncbi:DNA replication/repair protein RecF [Acidilutibacter cellobiosedens]|jgi:DNA replication and repair protein RecF|uniref:DNA replication/repair protein RecF n=1 Tax=Acidilutibacter cellobiosedens TaxID=2507161 RepID=UPI001F0C487A|nr:DNA replication/repair protein RecF [Acidilutibacter cellobiosedens]